MVITRLEVSNSQFLDRSTSIPTPSKLLIGGRGTGKSTIRVSAAGPCATSAHLLDEDDAVTYQEKRASLIDKTLASAGSVVTVSPIDSVPHSSQVAAVSLKIRAADFRSVPSPIRDPSRCRRTARSN